MDINSQISIKVWIVETHTYIYHVPNIQDVILILGKQ